MTDINLDDLEAKANGRFNPTTGRMFREGADPDVTLALVAALRAVLKMHDEYGTEGLCNHCNDWNGSDVPYPCPTRRAITEALSGEAP